MKLPLAQIERQKHLSTYKSNQIDWLLIVLVLFEAFSVIKSTDCYCFSFIWSF